MEQTRLMIEIGADRYFELAQLLPAHDWSARKAHLTVWRQVSPLSEVVNFHTFGAQTNVLLPLMHSALVSTSPWPEDLCFLIPQYG